MKKNIAISLVFIIILTSFSFSVPVGRYFEIAKNMEIFAHAFREINLSYLHEVNPNKIIKKGIDNMLSFLDPYTNFIPEDEVESFRTLNTGQYGGIGAITQMIEGRTVVSMLYEGYPAEKNGLKIGDEIIKIEGTELSKISNKEAMKLMHGQIGTPINITVKRMGSTSLLVLQFIRQKIKINSIPYYGIISENIGYVQLSNFTPKSSKEIKSTLISLKKEKIKSIILDLRGNPGGLLLEAVNICGLFMPKGTAVVTTKGKTERSNAAYKTREETFDSNIPLAILIDKKSASASEIVAGSLQDYDRAIIIGEKSFGKGLVQLNRPLPYNSQLKVTTAKYYTPSGRCIQALDYSHKQADGRAYIIPDSLKQEFKTTHGRSVYDGGGVSPDIAIASPQLSSFSQMLRHKGLIFDYATLYTIEHPEIVSAKNFTIDEQEYEKFKSWVEGRGYNYNSPITKELDRFKEQAKKEQNFDQLEHLYDHLNEAILKNENDRFIIYKNEIKKMLKEDIISRYYFEKGVIEARLQYDSSVIGAIKILRDSLAYKEILNVP